MNEDALAGSVETGGQDAEPTAEPPVEAPPERWRMLAIVATAELLAMGLWFSASAVGPELAARWSLSPAATAWLTNAVQLGFVAGALASAALTLADAVRPRWLFAGSAAAGAAATAAIPVLDDPAAAIALRFLTGAALAGVYPPGMKLVAGWFREGRGLAIGALVGALTVGSALPHLLRGAGGVGDPALVLYGAAGLALVGAGLALLARPGPFVTPAAPFDPGAARRVLADRATMLANLGYFGHMFELYAVWAWIPAYVAASLAAGGTDTGTGVASLVAFATIAVGGAGALVAGRWADRWGRTRVTEASLVASGTACVGAGVAFGAPLAALVPFLLAWGAVIVADSAQFSAAVSELAEPAYVGTALTLQTAVGFLLTTVSIQLVPVFAGAVGWQWAFAPLALGPAAGALAMRRLRARPEAARLAGGRG